MKFKRSSGILLHISSLPGPDGIGDLGAEAYHWINFLHESGTNLWQVLPLGPTGYGDSPYQCFSAFAGNPYLISPALLLADDLLTREALAKRPEFSADTVDYGRVIDWKTYLLDYAYDRFRRKEPGKLRKAYNKFVKKKAWWLDDFAIFMAIKEVNNEVAWSEWDRPLRLREPDALERVKVDLAETIMRHKFRQFLFFRQWENLHDYAHQKGVIHRDIKPSNIILNSAGRIKITDFGVAQIEDLLTIHQTQAGAIIGTPVYMPPEQVNGQPVDGRSDLYALGVILYELLTGAKPFTGENFAAIFAAIINSRPAVPVEIASGISKAQSDLIIKSISKEPDRRFQTGREMAAALKATFTESQAAESSLKNSDKQRSHFTGVFLIAALAAAVMIGGIYYYLNVRPPKPEPEPELVVNIVRNAVLQVSSTPDNAQVFINNLLKGKTPLVLKLPLGKYEIRVSRPEYYEWEAELNLDKEEETPLAVRLTPISEVK